MKRTLLIALAATGLFQTTSVSALPRQLCPVPMLLELARQIPRTVAGRPAPESPLPPGSEPRFEADSGLWGIDAAARDQAMESFVRNFGEEELCGIFLIGSRASGRSVPAGTRPRPDSDANFVVFVRNNRSYQAEIARVRAELREVLGDIPIQVHGVITECSDCPLRTTAIPVVLGDAPSYFPVMAPPACAASVANASGTEAIRLWP